VTRSRAGCEKIFTDKMSGVRGDRRGLADALSLTRKGDVFVIWKLDRLGRSVCQLVQFVEDLKGAGVDFMSLTEGFDTTTPAGRFFCHMMAALAEMERDLMLERTRAGLAAAKARGRRGGRRPKLSPEQIVMARRLLKDLESGDGGGRGDVWRRTRHPLPRAQRDAARTRSARIGTASTESPSKRNRTVSASPNGKASR
jgi:DNA invertase Pin-like site-specific DNA recombinase